MTSVRVGLDLREAIAQASTSIRDWASPKPREAIARSHQTASGVLQEAARTATEKRPRKAATISGGAPRVSMSLAPTSFAAQMIARKARIRPKVGSFSQSLKEIGWCHQA